MMKRLFIACLLLLAMTPPISAQIAFTTRKAANENAGAGATSAVTINSQIAGNTTVCAVFWCASASCLAPTNTDTFTVTDNNTNTYNGASPDIRQNTTNAAEDYAEAIVHASNINSGNATITLTVTTATPFYATISCSEWSGVTNSSPLDQTGTTDLASSASPVSVATSSPTTAANELVYSFFAINAGTLAAGGCCTALNAPVTNLGDEYQISATSGTYTNTMTYGSSTGKTGVLATFKPVAAAPGFVKRHGAFIP